MAAKKSSGGIPLNPSADIYREAAEQGRAHMHELAGRIERGEDVLKWERKLAAAALRRVADDLPKEQPKQRGGQPTIDYGSVALEYMAMTKRPDEPMSGFRALGALAEKYGVSEDTIRNAVRQYGAEAASWFEPDE